jgi:hypothetical protein
MSDSGDHSDELLIMALRQRTPFHFHGAPLHVDPQVLYDPSCVGAVSHWPGHWVALRYIREQDQVWLLDSMYEPRPLSSELYVQFARDYRDTYAILHAEALDVRGYDSNDSSMITASSRSTAAMPRSPLHGGTPPSKRVKCQACAGSALLVSPTPSLSSPACSSPPLKCPRCDVTITCSDTPSLSSGRTTR